MQTTDIITIKTRCIFRNGNKILVTTGFDKVTNKTFYCLLGGTMNFFETGETCIRREIQEELHSDIENLKLIDVSENLFTYEANNCHEIIFLYSGDLVQKELYSKDSIHIVEDTYEIDAIWVDINDILFGKMSLYPDCDYKVLFMDI